ncbi:VTT domain-containing protein [Achromobacter sp. GG226]|uniref:VTT domain-containing protein n=1 Tax=Verticiella alkaliphila TaxID=2779529 RepID=UPI001C0AE321|nr:VTT domain-containing protein [Verticiella sp. GG226]MBU4611815.1 VTT domain-containing protein [Verticiella sp. GG226]
MTTTPSVRPEQDALVTEPLLVPGRNCWRTGACTRLAFAAGAQAQALALREALEAARKTVFIVGWHVDSRTRLPANGSAPAAALGDLLLARLHAVPGLRVYVLAWDFSMLYSAQRQWPPVYRQAWPDHRRLVHRLDARHPAGGAHHQNFVVVDDALAFVGGLDLARDTRQGDARPAPADAPGERNLQVVFDGGAAAWMGELARERWQASAGRPVARLSRTPASDAAHPWPPSLAPTVRDVTVGIARTAPAYGGRPGVGEIRQLYLDAVSHARHSLYLENAYFTAQALAGALTQRMREPAPPEVVLVTQRDATGWLDERAMQVLRARACAEIGEADGAGRFQVFAPVTAPADGTSSVRNKLLLVDDELICIGSANVNNRSFILDTECQVVVAANGRDDVRAALAHLRAELVGARLGQTAAEVATATAQDGIAQAIITADPDAKTLAPFTPQASVEDDALVGPGVWLDSERPVAPERLIDQFMSDVAAPRARRRAVLVGLVLALVLVMGLWRWTPLSDYLSLGFLMSLGYALKALPYAALAVVGCYVLGGLIAMPITVLIAASGLVFGAWQGGWYALAGTMLSALVTYGVGRLLGRDTVRRLAGPRINALSERIASQGILAMVVLRVLPVAPFSLVNVMAGASHISLRDYLVGTFLGMAPGIVLTVSFAHQLARAMEDPDALSIAIVVAAAVGLIVAAWGIQRGVDALGRARQRKDAARAQDAPVGGETV